MRVLARIYALWGGFLLGAALMLLAGVASATTLVFDNSGNIVGSSAGTWGGKAVTWGSASVQGGGVGVSANLPTVVTGGKSPVTVPVVASRVLSPAALGRVAVKGMKGLLPGLVIGSAVMDELRSAGYECDLSGCRTIEVSGSSYPAVTETVPAVDQRFGKCANSVTTFGPTVGPFSMDDTASIYPAACAAAGQHWHSYYGCWSGPNGSGQSRTCTNWIAKSCDAGYTLSGSTCSRLSCPSGGTLSGASCVVTGSPSVPASDEVVANAVGPDLVGPSGVQMVNDAISAGVPLEADPVQLSGPPSSSSPPVTTTVTANGQTTTHQTTTTVVNTYNSNSYTYNITNTTVTSGASSGTTVEEVPEDDQASVSDSAMPELPKLYERKYPDGLGGVWSSRSAELRATPLFGLSAIFQPTVLAGSCPSWAMAFNFGTSMNYGSATTSAPCWIWPFVKVIVIITALLLARRLIFGG